MYFDGKVLYCNDYKELISEGVNAPKLNFGKPNKGLSEEIEALVEGLKTATFPIPLWQQFQATEIANLVEENLK